MACELDFLPKQFEYVLDLSIWKNWIEDVRGEEILKMMVKNTFTLLY